MSVPPSQYGVLHLSAHKLNPLPGLTDLKKVNGNRCRSIQAVLTAAAVQAGDCRGRIEPNTGKHHTAVQKKSH